jgi:hypothetical protein
MGTQDRAKGFMIGKACCAGAAPEAGLFFLSLTLKKT